MTKNDAMLFKNFLPLFTLVELLLVCAWKTCVSWARKLSAMNTSWALCRSRETKKKFD